MALERVRGAIDGIGDWFSKGGKRLAVLLLAVMLVSGTTAAGVTVIALGINPLAAGSGQLTDAQLQINSASLGYDGLDVSSADVVVENTDGSGAAHSGEVTVILKNDTSGTLESQTATVSSLSDGNTVTVSVAFTGSHSVQAVDTVQVRIEQTS